MGLDRVDAINQTSRWHPEIAALSKTWMVIALKHAIDSMEVGKDSVLFPTLLVDLVDALIGTGAHSIDANILRKRTPDPSIWLAITRSLGDDEGTNWQDSRIQLIRHLNQIANEAITLTKVPEHKETLEKIASRTLRQLDHAASEKQNQ